MIEHHLLELGGDIRHQVDQAALDDQQGEIERYGQHSAAQRLAQDLLFALGGHFWLAQEISQRAFGEEPGDSLHIVERALKGILLQSQLEHSPRIAACNRSFKHYCSPASLAFTNSSTRRRLSFVSTDLLMTLPAAWIERLTTRRLSSARARAASC